MLRRNRTINARAMMLVAISSLTLAAFANVGATTTSEPVATTAKAEDSSLSFFKDLQFSGYLDLYYQYSFNKPLTGQTLTGRQFDVTQNQFSFASLAFNVVKPISKDNPVGFTLNTFFGKTADVQNSTEPGGESLKYIQQAYISFGIPEIGATVDAGKFLTWIGYETPVSVDQPIYSRPFLYYYGQPTYHSGIRASAPVGSGLTASIYAVNGWNETEDSNGSKSLGATVSGTFGKTGVTASYYGGNEGTTGPVSGFGTTNQNVQLGDFIVTHQLTPTIKLALNADYAAIKNLETAGGAGHYFGFASYVTAQVSPKVSGTIRYEAFNDYDGYRTGSSSTLSSVALGLDYATSKTSTFKLELRYDKANNLAFEGDSGLKDNRTTLTFAHIIKF